jgi:ADP-ribosyl-[dinitrogen reductase] hydrolase
MGARRAHQPLAEPSNDVVRFAPRDLGAQRQLRRVSRAVSQWPPTFFDVDISGDRAARQRALGAVIGSAVGDALGAPFEFGAPGEYSRRFPEPVVGGIGEMVGGGGYSWAPGEFTDDTQMAIVQAESLLDRGGVDGADLFERFGVWAQGASDVGVQTRTVLTSPHGWETAASRHFERNPGGAAGNGSLMRSAPTAVHYATTTVAETVEAARATSAVTHGDPAAAWGVALFHLMVRAAVHGEDPEAALTEGLEMLPDDQDRYRRMLAPSWRPESAEVPNGSVWGCLASAVFALRNTETFADAVTTAIDLGDDTDTVAAVTGGLAGAVYGIQAIPSRWTTYLHGQVDTPDGEETYRSARLQELALRLIGADPAPDNELGPGLGPTEIAPGVHAADLAGAATVPQDWAVISLCRVGDTFAHHSVRRVFYVIDKEGDHNSGLSHVVTDAVETLDAFRAEGRQVVVHCHGGASRTGLVLRAWLMRINGWDEPTATDHLRERWPHLGEWNETFSEFLRSGS